MGRLRDFYLDRYKHFLDLLRKEFIHEQESGYIEIREAPDYVSGGVIGAIHADRRHQAGGNDVVTPELFSEIDEVLRLEKARLCASFFIEVLANEICHKHYRSLHDKFQGKNRFPLIRDGADFSAWTSIPEARKIFDMAFGSRERDGHVHEIPENSKEWLKRVLSGTVHDMQWIVFNSLDGLEIDKNEFWGRCVEQFPDWLKGEANRLVRRS